METECDMDQAVSFSKVQVWLGSSFTGNSGENEKRGIPLKVLPVFETFPAPLFTEKFSRTLNPFSWIFNAISSDKSCLIST